LILIGLISNLYISPDVEIHQVMDVVYDRIGPLAVSYGLTTFDNRGKAIRNFVGDNSIISVGRNTQTYDDESIELIPAVKAVYSSEFDISMTHPSEISGNYGFILDPVLLIAKYMAWVRIRVEDNLNTNIGVFIYSVIYTEMIKDILKLNIANAFIYNKDLTRTKKHKFYTTDFSKKLKYEIDSQLKTLSLVYATVEDKLKSINVFGDTLDVVLSHYKLLGNTYTLPFYFAIRTKILVSIFDKIITRRELELNRVHITELHRVVRSVIRNGVKLDGMIDGGFLTEEDYLSIVKLSEVES